MPRFAANLTMMFGELPFLDRFEAAAKAGFKSVEFLFPYEHPAQAVRDAAERAGVDIVLFNFPPGDWAGGERGIGALPGRESEVTAALQRGIDYALTLQVPRVHLMAGNIAVSATSRARFEDALREATALAAPHGIDILLEPLNPRDMPGYFLGDFALAEELIGSLGLPNLKLQFDIYHRQIMHGDVSMALRRMLPIIGHIQTASVPLRNEPGTGELDDFRIFRLLDEIGYAGHIGCEYRPATSTLEGLGWLAGCLQGLSTPVRGAQ